MRGKMSSISRFLVIAMLLAIFVSIPNTSFANEDSFESEDIEISSYAPDKRWVRVSLETLKYDYVFYEETYRDYVYRGYLKLVGIDGIYGVYEGYLYREDLPYPIPTKLKLEQEELLEPLK